MLSDVLHFYQLGITNRSKLINTNDLRTRLNVFKGPFHDLQPHPPSPFFSKKVEIFTSVEALWYIWFVCKIIVANCQNCWFIVPTLYIPAYETVWYSKTYITHKRNLRINWKYGNKLILSVPLLKYVIKIVWWIIKWTFNWAWTDYTCGENICFANLVYSTTHQCDKEKQRTKIKETVFSHT